MKHTASKKKTKIKEATFKLAPDGFSIHTFELSRKLSKQEYRNIKSSLYSMAKASGSTMYKTEDGNHVCGLFSNHGIRLSLHHNQQSEYSNRLIKMVINPRKLIDPECSYLGILNPEGSSIRQLRKSFKALFRDTEIDSDIDAYYISRLDFCANVHCDNNSIFRELVRVLRKLPTPAKYQRLYHKGKDRKAVNRYNKHYLKFTCGTHTLAIYDKTYQAKREGLDIGYDKLPKGILRFEVQCEREYIRKLEQKYSSDGTCDLLWACVQDSQNVTTGHFNQCWGDASFYPMATLQTRIQDSRYSEEDRHLQLKLVTELQRKQSVDKALDKLKLSDSERKQLLKQFKKMKISPIPLHKRFCADMLFSPVTLLRYIGNDVLTMEYYKTISC